MNEEWEKRFEALKQSNPELAKRLVALVDEIKDDNDPCIADLRWLFSNAPVAKLKERFQRSAGIKS